MKKNKEKNEKMVSENHLKNSSNNYQEKNGNLPLLVILVLYAVLTAISWKYRLFMGLPNIDLSFLLLIIALYFRFAKKKLIEGNSVKKYDHPTRQTALWIIFFVIIINVLLLLLFVLGDFLNI